MTMAARLAPEEKGSTCDSHEVRVRVRVRVRIRVRISVRIRVKKKARMIRSHCAAMLRPRQ